MKQKVKTAKTAKPVKTVKYAGQDVPTYESCMAFVMTIAPRKVE